MRSVLKKPVCRAANPSLCRYHGNQATMVANRRYEVAYKVYAAALGGVEQADYDTLLGAYNTMIESAVGLLATPGGFEAGLRAREAATDPNEVVSWDRAFEAAAFRAEALEKQEEVELFADRKAKAVRDAVPFAPPASVSVGDVLVAPRGERVSVSRNGQRLFAVGSYGSYSFSWNMDNGRLLATYYDDEDLSQKTIILKENVSSVEEATGVSSGYVARIYS